MKGYIKNKVWMRDDKNLALSFASPSTWFSCYSKMIIFDQGFAISEAQFDEFFPANRHKREKMQVVPKSGSVKSEQLASELTADQQLTVENIETNLLKTICNEISGLGGWKDFLGSTNPTLVARRLLGNELLEANWISEWRSVLYRNPPQKHNIFEDNRRKLLFPATCKIKKRI